MMQKGVKHKLISFLLVMAKYMGITTLTSHPCGDVMKNTTIMHYTAHGIHMKLMFCYL